MRVLAFGAKNADIVKGFGGCGADTTHFFVECSGAIGTDALLSKVDPRIKKLESRPW